MKLLILGGSGLVGSRFLELATEYDISAPTHEELDLFDYSALENFVDQSGAECIINFAAFTNVDAAEKEKDDKEGNVYRLNVSVPELLAQNCLDSGKYLVHISTDYIFDGTKQTPYEEDDTPNPVNWYGTTKYLGEEAIKSSSPDFLIVRPEIPYTAKFDRKLDLARTFIKMLNEGSVINGVSDQKITPTFVDTLVFGILRLVEVQSAGVYHLASTDATTPYDFAMMIAAKFGLSKAQIKSIPFAQYNETRTAKRPQNSYLDVSKFVTEFGEGILTSNQKSIEELYSLINSQK